MNGGRSMWVDVNYGHYFGSCVHDVFTLMNYILLLK